MFEELWVDYNNPGKRAGLLQALFRGQGDADKQTDGGKLPDSLRTELGQLQVCDAFIGTGKSVGGSGHLILI